jgi:hypothetical protein
MNVMQAPKEIQRVRVLQVIFLRCLRRLCKMYNLLKSTREKGIKPDYLSIINYQIILLINNVD